MSSVQGREQTVNYVPSKHRFTLTLSDTTVIGERRAAQVIGATAMKELSGSASEPTTDVVDAAVRKACYGMAAEKESLPGSLTWAVLQQQDAQSSQSIITLLQDDPTFKTVAKAQEDGILKRDAEDSEKLSAGIQIGIDRGVLASEVTCLA